MPMTQLDYFTSYSSNSEDVILHRLFGDRSSGFYIDVGAGHPTFDNDMRALYDQGWSGINVEPNPQFFTELVRERPRDRNLQLALSDEDGVLDYWEVAGTGLSTCDIEEAARARAKGHNVSQTSVRSTTLAQILDEVQPSAIDILKVDVEGYEIRVLQGNDWTRYRPAVIQVEVTIPETPERRPDRLRPFLEQNGYDFAYFDGLNDFFVERSFVYSNDAFRAPNVFDRVLPYTTKILQAHAKALEHGRDVQAEYIESLQMHVAAVEKEREQERARRQSLQDHMAIVEGDLESRSGELEKLRQEGTAVDAQVKALKADIVNAKAAIIDLEQETVHSRREAARLTHQAKLSQISIARNREEAAQALNDASRLSGHVSALRQQLNRAAFAEAGLHASVVDHIRALRDIRESSRRELSELTRLLAATRTSTSWRVTRPLRGLSRLLRGII